LERGLRRKEEVAFRRPTLERSKRKGGSRNSTKRRPRGRKYVTSTKNINKLSNSKYT